METGYTDGTAPLFDSTLQAKTCGYGAVTKIAEISGYSRGFISRGLTELEDLKRDNSNVLSDKRVRKPGGKRKG